MKVAAKPIEWEESIKTWQWESRCNGLYINRHLKFKDDTNPVYNVSWHHGKEVCLPTLEEAQKWCQDILDAWVHENVVVSEE